MKSRFLIRLSSLLVACILMFSLCGIGVFAYDIEVITPAQNQQSQGSTYVPTQPQQTMPPLQQGSSGTVVPNGGSQGSGTNIIQQIANGEDHASQLFGTDQFKPQQVDNSWLIPIINGVSWLASAACGIFGTFTLVKMLVDLFCILVPVISTLLDNLSLSWLYSDVCAALIGKTGSEGMPEGATPRSLPNVGDVAQGTISGKLVYWFKESMFTAVVAGAVLIGIATGVVPDLINFCVNFIINGIVTVMNLIKG